MARVRSRIYGPVEEFFVAGQLTTAVQERELQRRAHDYWCERLPGFARHHDAYRCVMALNIKIASLVARRMGE